MEIQIPEATELKDLGNGKYSAVIGGKVIDGISDVSMFMPSVQQAIDNGEPVESYMPYVPTPADLLDRTDNDLIKVAARTLEDIIDERITEGKFVAQTVKDKIAERKALREQL